MTDAEFDKMVAEMRRKEEEWYRRSLVKGGLAVIVLWPGMAYALGASACFVLLVGMAAMGLVFLIAHDAEDTPEKLHHAAINMFIVMWFSTAPTVGVAGLLWLFKGRVLSHAH